MRWTDVLLVIHRTHASRCYCERLCRVLNCSRTHIRVIVSKLASGALVEIIPYKNVNRVQLTEKGKNVTLALQTLKAELQSAVASS